MRTNDSLVYLPPGWPAGVRPPGSTDWTATAVSFLLDCCPPDFRAYPVLRSHPLVLARFAARFVDAHREAATDGLAEIRVSLAGDAPPQVIEQAALAWQQQQAALVLTSRAVALVEQALRGEVFVRKLG